MSHDVLSDVIKALKFPLKHNWPALWIVAVCFSAICICLVLYQLTSYMEIDPADEVSVLDHSVSEVDEQEEVEERGE